MGSSRVDSLLLPSQPIGMTMCGVGAWECVGGLRDVKLARVRSLSSLVCHPSRGFVFVLIILYSLDLEYDSALFRSASMSGTDYYTATNPLARQSRGMCDFYVTSKFCILWMVQCKLMERLDWISTRVGESMHLGVRRLIYATRYWTY